MGVALYAVGKYDTKYLVMVI